MCIFAIAQFLSERFPIVIIDNRDEMLKRRTQNASIDERNVLCCHDMQPEGHAAVGGSWMGLNVKTMEFCVLTNARAQEDVPQDFKAKVSRGYLVTDHLASDGHRSPHCMKSDELRGNYDGFNFLSGNLVRIAARGASLSKSEMKEDEKASTFQYTSNRFGRPLGKAIHSSCFCSSNTCLDHPDEPKSNFLRQKLEELMEGKELEKMSIGDVMPTLARLLCARPNFTEFKDGFLDSAKAEAFADYEAEFQRNIFTTIPKMKDRDGNLLGDFVTRTQTVCVVEKMPPSASADGEANTADAEYKVWYWVRNCKGPDEHEMWQQYGLGPFTLDKATDTVREVSRGLSRAEEQEKKILAAALRELEAQ